MADQEEFEDLLDGSSLGSDRAREVQALCPPGVVDHVSRYAAQLAGGSFVDPRGATVSPGFGSGQSRVDALVSDPPWCRVCAYVPPDALVRVADDVMPLSLAREPDGCWSALADEVYGDQTVFADSAGWDVDRAAKECDGWLGRVSLPRVASWVSVPHGALHAHCVYADLPLCSVCGHMVVGGTEVTAARGADGDSGQWVVCSTVECRDGALELVRAFHRPAIAVVPLWPGVSA